MPTIRPSLPLLASAAVLAAASGCAKPEPAPAPPRAALTVEQAEAAAAGAITAEALRSRIAAFSDDALEGRGPGSAGDVAARAWLIEQMQALGLEPAGDNGTWEQKFAMVGINATMPETWSFSGAKGSVALKRHDDFIAGSGVQRELAKIADAEVVFVGYGIDAPEYGWNDFDGVDLKGKVLLIMNNDPDWDPTLFEGPKRLWYGRWDYKYLQAAKQGAAGAIIIHTVPSAGYPFSVVQTSWSGEQFEIPAGDEPRIEVASWVTEDSARTLVALAGKDLDELTKAAQSKDFSPIPLGITTSMEMPVALRQTETANVLGVLRGDDPELAQQALMLSAHHDHLGVGLDDGSGDTIYNGAVDNASGCAQVLAIAEAFTKLPQRPRRSILLNFVGAEEQGLIGSKYWAAHPTWKPGLVTAAINIDGGNIWGRTRDTTSVGHGKSPDLDALLDRLAARKNRVVKPDQFPDKGFYYRSDQFAFARVGIPAIYMDGGTDFVDHEGTWGREQIEAWEAEKYHQPGDELDDTWNFDGMVEDATLLFAAGVELAEADTMASWRAGDEFEAAREAALAEVAPPTPTN